MMNKIYQEDSREWTSKIDQSNKMMLMALQQITAPTEAPQQLPPLKQATNKGAQFEESPEKESTFTFDNLVDQLGTAMSINETSDTAHPFKPTIAKSFS